MRESQIPITQRKAMRRDLPVEWLDALLVAACEMRPDASAEEAATSLVTAAFEVLPDAAIGVCVPGGSEGQVVVRRGARGDGVESPDPTRLFPEYAFERVVVINADEGSTLHLASDDEARFSGTGSMDAFVDRLALALASALRNARMHRAARAHGSEVKELEAQVIQAGKLASLGQIAAGIVHELNNPLTSIVAYSDYLHKKALRSEADPADVERLARINEAAERILRFSRDLMAYSRPTASVPAPVAIHETIERALVFCDHVLGEMNVAVEREFGDVRLVRGVGGQLTQVFVNLFTNAAHAMRTYGGRLIIKTAMSEAGDAVRVTIQDEGHGIDAAHIEKIFEPFFTTKTDGTGSGLGLSIVRNIVASHGGKIRAYGHPEKGTVFELDLPLAASPSEPPQR
ncbi:ATP-binding protein [Polyangium sp. 6x1]|uniref:sensor histidine kinase n=1 Tax=Polyangium sp. 6x1 TaxID=3042689 RepID=UPI00248267FF|nr:ATP-binding protein [Polyangium sp. 6x1]